MDYALIVFANTHSAISAQKILGEKLSVIIMPTLREISKSCGISVRVNPDDWQRASQLLLESGMSHDMYRIYSVTSMDGAHAVALLEGAPV